MCRFHDPGHPSHTANQHQLIDVTGCDDGVLQTGFYWPNGALEEVITKLFHLGASQLHADMFGATGIGGDEWQIDFVLLCTGQCDLGLLSFLFDPLQSIGLFAAVHPVLFLKLVEDPIHDAVIPIVTPKMRVTVSSLDFENSLTNLKHGNIERATAEVVNRNLFVLLFL